MGKLMIPVPVNGGTTRIDANIPISWRFDDNKYNEICAVPEKFNGEQTGGGSGGDGYDVGFEFATVKDAVAFWKYCTKKYKQMKNYHFSVYGCVGSHLHIDRKKSVLVPSLYGQDDAICEIIIVGNRADNERLYDMFGKNYKMSNVRFRILHNKNKEELVCYTEGIDNKFLKYMKQKKVSVLVYSDYWDVPSGMFVKRGDKSVPVEVII